MGAAAGRLSMLACTITLSWRWRSRLPGRSARSCLRRLATESTAHQMAGAPGSARTLALRACRSRRWQSARSSLMMRRLWPAVRMAGCSGRVTRARHRVLMATLADSAPINGLCWLPAGGWLVAGLGDGRVLRSADQGLTWQPVALGAPLLALVQCCDRLYAGLAEQGLLYSEDAGATWQTDSALTSRDLTRLADMQGRLLAYGATGGIWRAGGEDWERVVDPALQQPIEVITAVGDVLFVAAGAEIAALLEGERWVIVATITTGRVVAMASDLISRGRSGSPRPWHAMACGDGWSSLVCPGRAPY